MRRKGAGKWWSSERDIGRERQLGSDAICDHSE